MGGVGEAEWALEAEAEVDVETEAEAEAGLEGAK